jgi:hypothetical protein
VTLSFRGASARARNLEIGERWIPGLVLAHHPGMTAISDIPKFWLKNF